MTNIWIYFIILAYHLICFGVYSISQCTENKDNKVVKFCENETVTGDRMYLYVQSQQMTLGCYCTFQNNALTSNMTISGYNKDGGVLNFAQTNIRLTDGTGMELRPFSKNTITIDREAKLVLIEHSATRCIGFLIARGNMTLSCYPDQGLAAGGESESEKTTGYKTIKQQVPTEKQSNTVAKITTGTSSIQAIEDQDLSTEIKSTVPKEVTPEEVTTGTSKQTTVTRAPSAPKDNDNDDDDGDDDVAVRTTQQQVTTTSTITTITYTTTTTKQDTSVTSDEENNKDTSSAMTLVIVAVLLVLALIAFCAIAIFIIQKRRSQTLEKDTAIKPNGGATYEGQYYMQENECYVSADLDTNSAQPNQPIHSNVLECNADTVYNEIGEIEQDTVGEDTDHYNVAVSGHAAGAVGDEMDTSDKGVGPEKGDLNIYNTTNLDDNEYNTLNEVKHPGQIDENIYNEAAGAVFN